MNDTDAAPASPPPEIPASPAPVARTIGERLRAGRDRAGLSVPAAAEKLHLDPKVIEALEADRFAELGASVYVRGHLKRYADFVGEPGAELVSLYTNREVRAPAPDLTQVPHAERRADPRALQKPLVALGAAAVLLAAIWWVLAGSNTRQPATAALPIVVPAGAGPSDGPAVAATPASLAGNAAAPVAQTLPAAVTPAAAVVPATAAAPPPAAAPATAEAAPPRVTRLRLELASDSWVEVFDARGERLYADVASAGSVQNLEGRAPLRVMLGVAAGAAIEVNGERREIPGSAADGEGAHFVVNRSGSLSRARQ